MTPYIFTNVTELSLAQKIMSINVASEDSPMRKHYNAFTLIGLF